MAFNPNPHGYIPANDGVAEPFQPLPTGIPWTRQEEWWNREGTVIRTGLYLRDRVWSQDNFTTLAKSILDEAQARSDEDTKLEKEIVDTNIRIDGLDDWHQPLQDEVDARTAADTALRTDLDAEIVTRSAIDASTKQQITDETAARTAADATLTKDLSDEVTNRTTAVSTVDGKISTETLARINGDKANSDALKVLNDSLGTASKVDTGTAPGNVPVVQANGKLDNAVLPTVHTNNTFVVDSETAMLALSADVGDIAIRTDTKVTYVLKATPATALANWVELSSPAGGVTSWNGQTGPVTYTAPVTSVNTKTGAVVLKVNGVNSDASGNFVVTGDDIPISSGSVDTVNKAVTDLQNAPKVALYDTIGSNEDGAMTQKAVTDQLTTYVSKTEAGNTYLSKTDAEANYVGLTGDETISGKKTFANPAQSTDTAWAEITGRLNGFSGGKIRWRRRFGVVTVTALDVVPPVMTDYQILSMANVPAAIKPAYDMTGAAEVSSVPMSMHIDGTNAGIFLHAHPKTATNMHVSFTITYIP